jgi:hypothetical protein
MSARTRRLLPTAALAAAILSAAGAPQSKVEEWGSVVSNDGSWRVQWRVMMGTKQLQLPEVRKRFTLELRIESLLEPRRPVRGVLVDAQMPDHVHGMNVAPTVLMLEGGGVASEGMLFHMSGRWEVDVDIDDGETIERAQWDIGMY